MRGDALDVVLVVVAAAFAVSGYRQGFVVGSLSFAGFVGGAVLGAEFGPPISRALAGERTQQDVIAVILLISGAIIGQFVAASLGAATREMITGHSSATLDAIGGSAVSVLSMLLIVWAIGSVLMASPLPVVDQQVNNSAVLSAIDKVMPGPAKTMFSGFRRLLASGPFPQVFSGIGAAHLFSVPAPDPAVLDSSGYLAARSRIVKVRGVAPSCGKTGSFIEGSGIVYAPDHVLTDAHVVAGVTQGPTVTTVNGSTDPATVVFYDPQVDVAVLYVPGLNLTPLRFTGQAHDGADAIVAGYPLNGSLTAVPARIGQVQRAVGPDIYHTGQVDRQVYQVRAVVEAGNSGGPLLSPAGSVYGVVFASQVGSSDSGFALTAAEVASDARAGASTTVPVSTQGCDSS